MTPRGSGTSGYVQKNLSQIRRVRNRDEFVKEMQNMKDNPIDARKQANPEILLHEQKRDIEVKKLQLREELESRSIAEEEIVERVSKLEARLKELLDRGQYTLNNNSDTHARTMQKELQEKKFNTAFGVTDKSYQPGSAFDFDTQDRERLENKYQRELKKAEYLIKMKEQKKTEKKQLKEAQKLIKLNEADIKVEDKDGSHKKEKKDMKDKKDKKEKKEKKTKK